MPRRKVSYRPVRYFLRRTNINSSRSKDRSNTKEGTNLDQSQNESLQSHSKSGHAYPINNILVLPQNSETLINVISPNSKNFSFKKVFQKLSRRRRKEKQRLKKAQTKCDVKPDVTKLKVNMKKTLSINRHTIILSDSEDDTCIKSEPVNTGKKHISKSTDRVNTDDDVIIVEVNKESEVIEIDDSCNEELNSSKTECDVSASEYKTTERNELLSTPESSTSNDFLENSQSNANSNFKFNFGLHGSEFKDSEFLKPSVPVDVSESGSVSSVSDIGSSIKTNVFNVVDFPKEREDLFNENNLDKFKDSITPQRHSVRCDEGTNNSKQENRNLPTLSHIQSDDNQIRRVRGRSIIRELVNDRAYVLLASAEKKNKKKRKSREEIDNSSGEVSGDISSDSAKKKKKKKKKQDVEVNSEPYCQFTEKVKTSNTSSTPIKNILIENKRDKNKKVETAENFEDTNQKFGLAVRNDLYSENESNTSANSKKGRKKDKSLQEDSVTEVVQDVEHKRKHKKTKRQTDKISEVPLETSKKRKKEKSLSECSANDTYEGKQKTKKKKRKTLESEDISYTIVTDAVDTPTEIQVSEINQVIAPLIEHQKKTCDSYENADLVSSKDTSIRNVQETNPPPFSTDLESSHIDTMTCMTEITGREMDIPAQAAYIEENTIQVDLCKEEPPGLEEQSESLGNTVAEGNQSIQIQLSDPAFVTNENLATVSENIEDGKSNFKSKTHISTDDFQNLKNSLTPRRCDSVNEENCNNEKKNDAECNNDKAPSVWNMCSSNFFASSESLFVVSDARSVTELDSKSEAIDTPLVNLAIDESPCISNVSSTQPLFNISDIEKGRSELKPSPENNKDTPPSQGVFEGFSIPLSSEQISTIKTTENAQELEPPQVSNNSQNINSSVKNISRVLQETDNAPILVEVKEEISDENQRSEIRPSQIIETSAPTKLSGESSIHLTEEIVIKEESTQKETHLSLSKESQNSHKDSSTVISSSCLNETEASIEKTDKLISSDIIKNIIQEKDNIRSVTRLCEFLEEAKDPNEVLKKVSMIKQAFLAKSMDSEVNPLDVVTSKNDDILSISSDNSDSSSVICLENNSPIIDIEDDISLANCGVGESIDVCNAVDVPTLNASNVQDVIMASEKETTLGQSRDMNESRKDKAVDVDKQIDPLESSNVVLRYGEVQKYARSLDKYEVEAIQKSMKDDPMLWQVSSADLPSNRLPAKTKRCIKCKELGHLGNKCPNKQDLPKCYLCGSEGHLEFRCPNRICTKCGTKSANMQSSCNYCKHYNQIKCSLCTMRGHPRNKCPDLWRRYHLTVNHGPLVKTDGMKLKNRDELWCSACSKQGHLEYYCFSVINKRTYQQLDPRIHHYQDVYLNSDFGAAKNSAGGVISETTLLELRKNLGSPTKNSRENVNVEPNTKDLPNELEKDVMKPRDVNSMQKDSPISTGLDDLPPGFVVVDEVNSESTTPILCGAENSTSARNEPIHIDETNSSILRQEDKLQDSVDNSVVVLENSQTSETTGTADSDTKSETNASEPNPFQAVRAFLKISEKTMGSKPFIPNFKMEFFFMNCSVDLLKKFLARELLFLKNSQVKIKDMFFKFLAYEKDIQKPEHEREISAEKHLIFSKSLNMLIFGKELLKGGQFHLKKLEYFVESPVGFFTDAMRESVYISYDYIFSIQQHPFTHYSHLLKLLMDKYGYKKKNPK